MESVYVDLLAHEFNAEGYSAGYFGGPRGGAGHFQTAHSKRKFIKWFVHEQVNQAAISANDIITAEGVEKTREMFASSFAFFFWEFLLATTMICPWKVWQRKKRKLYLLSSWENLATWQPQI
jgi:hypothetical protein